MVVRSLQNKLIPDVAYGPSQYHRMDVYIPKGVTRNAPWIFMVHGGGWRNGDKRNPNVVNNKLNYWRSRGYVMIFPNYRLDGVTPLDEFGDIQNAWDYAVAHVKQWGGDPDKGFGMGHSAGGNLITLLAASTPANMLGTVVLDSAAYNVPDVMAHQHPSFYDDLFGGDVPLQEAMSPSLVINRTPAPMFLVARNENEAGQLPESKLQMMKFAGIAQGHGGVIQTSVQDLSHAEINNNLGLPGDYTSSVAKFMTKLL